MEEVAIGWWGLGASLVLVVAAVGVSLGRRLELERELLVASGRALGQLVLAGWALTLLLDGGTSLWWAWLWVAVMIPVAAVTAQRREPRLPGLVWTTAAGYLLGLGASLAVVFGFGVFPLEARVLVPISGMVVGNSLRVVVVAATRLVDSINERSGEIEALLALGFDRRRAVRNISAQALRLALLPQIESTRSVGIVFLPGALTGLILAGVDPLDAALIQAAILFLILGSAAITGTVVVLAGASRFMTADHRLVPPGAAGS